MNDVEIITTGDGSHSLYNKSLNETYHSQHGAIQESLHVFIVNGLNYLAKPTEGKIRILEIGFGTGLNAWLTLNANSMRPGREISYTSIEAFPLPENLWQQLNYAGPGQEEMFSSLHKAEWNKDVPFNDLFTLRKLHTTLHDVILPSDAYDLIYFDAFAPSKQPDMWSLDILTKVTAALASGGVFVTYCAKGQLKRDLKSLGLIVESLPGPPPKKEMVRALKA
ncbi:MAG TPA: tRNA (5-methylaminomethyl-2-thiouridine)(34)-methyltransferase MnmD [Chryseosolibacter sp.]|nr:tRNA (5-methylaminomethyl-2-thiouridine)(34)-methyltransferase MnmD [Chryseosolibacter sp.]